MGFYAGMVVEFAALLALIFVQWRIANLANHKIKLYLKGSAAHFSRLLVMVSRSGRGGWLVAQPAERQPFEAQPTVLWLDSGCRPALGAHIYPPLDCVARFAPAGEAKLTRKWIPRVAPCFVPPGRWLRPFQVLYWASVYLSSAPHFAFAKWISRFRACTPISKAYGWSSSVTFI